jgi:hypothetical protein
MTEKFEQFAIVELMGHSVISGLVSEQVIGGQPFVRVDVPTTQKQLAFTKFFGSGAIYCITPCDEATALIAIDRLLSRPIDLFKLNIPQLSKFFYHPEDDPEDHPAGD